MFLDPTGHHLIIALVPKSATAGVSPDFLYIHCLESPQAQQVKVRRIEKFKDHEITAVAFNPYHGNESTTGSILLGTSRGLIFETELNPAADGHVQRKQLYDLGLGLKCTDTILSMDTHTCLTTAGKHASTINIYK